MADVMTQEEIDNLLKNVTTDLNGKSWNGTNGNGATSNGSNGTAQRIATAENSKIKVYDFKRPDKFSKEQLRTIFSMHESFSRLTTTSLSALLRTMTHVRVASVDQLTYEEFVRSIPNPTTLAVISMDPLKGSAVMEIDPTITFAIVDRLFGGKGLGTKDISRDLTDIEQSVMENIVVRILANLRESWSQVIDLRPRLSQIEVNPQFAQIVPPNEMVILVTLEVRLGNVEGMLNFCVPYLTLKSVLSKLSAQYWYSSIRGGANSEDFQVLREKLSSMLVEMVVELGSAELPVRSVASMAVGDVISLRGTSVEGPLQLKVGNRVKFECRPGVLAKRMAVKLTKQVSAVSELDFEELGEE